MDLSDKAGKQVTISFESFEEHLYLGRVIRPSLGWLKKQKLVLAVLQADYPNRFSAVSINTEDLPDVLQRIDNRIEEVHGFAMDGRESEYEVSLLIEAAHRIVTYRGWLGNGSD